MLQKQTLTMYFYLSTRLSEKKNGFYPEQDLNPRLPDY